MKAEILDSHSFMADIFDSYSSMADILDSWQDKTKKNNRLVQKEHA